MRTHNGEVGLFFITIFCLVIFTMAKEHSRELSRDNDNDENESASSKSRILSRQRRYLIFPEGSNVQLVYCLTIGTYPRTDLVVGLTAALAWELPSKVEKKLSNLLHRQSRSVIFPKIEAFLQSAGLDGRSCVMRALCEAGQRESVKIGTGTLVEELLHAIFKLREDGTKFEIAGHQEYERAHESEENCSLLYPTCRHSIYNLDF